MRRYTLETIPSSAVCDGVVDCLSGQGEHTNGCATELAWFDDPEPKAMLAEHVCDAVEACSQGEDEVNCGGD